MTIAKAIPLSEQRKKQKALKEAKSQQKYATLLKKKRDADKLKNARAATKEKVNGAIRRATETPKLTWERLNGSLKELEVESTKLIELFSEIKTRVRYDQLIQQVNAETASALKEKFDASTELNNQESVAFKELFDIARAELDAIKDNPTEFNLFEFEFETYQKIQNQFLSWQENVLALYAEIQEIIMAL